MLDRVCPDKPLIVWHRSFHELFANSEALRGTEFEDEEALRSHPQVMMMMMMMIILIPRWTGTRATSSRHTGE